MPTGPFGSNESERCILDFTGSTIIHGSSSSINTHAADYVTIKGGTWIGGNEANGAITITPGSNYITVDGIELFVNAGAYGIYSKEATTGLKIINNTIHGNDESDSLIYFRLVNDDNITSFEISNNTLEASGGIASVSLVGISAATAYFSDGLIENNEIFGGSGAGIRVTSLPDAGVYVNQNIVIQGNRITDTGDNGIIALGLTGSSSIRNNTLRNIGLPPTGSNVDGIRCASCNGVAIEGNTIESVYAVEPSSHGNGILVDQWTANDMSYSCQNMTIARNKITGCMTGYGYGIYNFRSTGSIITGNIVQGNKTGIVVGEANGIQSTATVAHNTVLDSSEIGCLVRENVGATTWINNLMWGSGLYDFATLDGATYPTVLSNNLSRIAPYILNGPYALTVCADCHYTDMQLDDDYYPTVKVLGLWVYSLQPEAYFDSSAIKYGNVQIGALPLRQFRDAEYVQTEGTMESQNKKIPGEICRINADGTGQGIANVVVSRASSVTGVDPDGILRTYGENEMSFNNGMIQSLPASGYANLIDEPDLSQWGVNAVAAASGREDPMGGTNAHILTTTSDENLYASRMLSGLSLVDNEQYTFSLYVKKIGDSAFRLRLYDATAVASLAQVRFSWNGDDLEVDYAEAGTGHIEKLGNGWFRVSVTCPASTVVAANDNRAYIYPQSTVGGNSLYVFGPQLTESAYPLPYTPDSVGAQTLTVNIRGEYENLLPEFSTWTTPNDYTVTPSFSSPDGGNNAYQVTSTTEDQALYIQYSEVGATAHNFSVWLRADTAKTVTIGGSTFGFRQCPVTTEWQRFDVTDSDGSRAIGVWTGERGVDYGTVYVFGPQLTESSHPLPYVSQSQGVTSLHNHKALRDALSDSDTYDTDGKSAFTMLAVIIPEFNNQDTLTYLINSSEDADGRLLAISGGNDRFFSRASETASGNAVYSESSVFGNDAGETYWFSMTCNSTAGTSGEHQICVSSDFGENWSCGSVGDYDGSFALGDYLTIGLDGEFPFDIGPIIFFERALSNEEATIVLERSNP